MKKIMAPRSAALLLILAAACAALWYANLRYAWWSHLIIWMMETQHLLHQKLARSIHLIAREDGATSWTLIGISLLYGVFHAAGPGHGKAVISTYLGTSTVHLRRGLLLSVLAALAQGVVAIALVEIMAVALGYSLRKTQASASSLESLSFAFIALVGLILLIRSAYRLYAGHIRSQAQAARFTLGRHTTGMATRQQSKPGLFSTEPGQGKLQAYCLDCGGPHQLGSQHINQALSWRTALPIILAIGLRPCTGAIIVLLAAYSLNIRWTGITAVLAMSLGTAATVSVLATATVYFRTRMLKHLHSKQTQPRLSQILMPCLGIVGGLFILLMGLDLLTRSLHTVPHPLL